MVVCWSQRLGQNRHAVLQHPFDGYDPAEFPRQYDQQLQAHLKLTESDLS